LQSPNLVSIVFDQLAVEKPDSSAHRHLLRMMQKLGQSRAAQTAMISLGAW
jgi:hypothetical protein